MPKPREVARQADAPAGGGLGSRGSGILTTVRSSVVVTPGLVGVGTLADTQPRPAQGEDPEQWAVAGVGECPKGPASCPLK